MHPAQSKCGSGRDHPPTSRRLVRPRAPGPVVPSGVRPVRSTRGRWSSDAAVRNLPRIVPLLAALLLAIVWLLGPACAGRAEAHEIAPASAGEAEPSYQEGPAGGRELAPVEIDRGWRVGPHPDDRTDPQSPDERGREHCAYARSGLRLRLDMLGSRAWPAAPPAMTPGAATMSGSAIGVRAASPGWRREPSDTSRDRHRPYLPAAPPVLG